MNATIEFCIFKLVISLCSKFQLKLTILIFWTKLPIKWWFPFKTKKVNTAIGFCTFDIGFVLNFSWKWKFWFSGPNLPKKGCFLSKTEKVKTTISFSRFELVLVRNCSWNWIFWLLLAKFAQNCVSSLKQEKWTSSCNSAYLS